MTEIVVLDTSALLGLVVDGPHREQMMAAFQRHPYRVASAMALTEALPAIDRLTDQRIQRDDLETAVRHIWDYLHIVPLDARCLEQAAHLARERPIRMSDALHLAAASRLPRPVTFATVDPTQIPVALDLGFEIWST